MNGSSFLETADIETASDDYASRFEGEVGRFFLEIQKDITLAFLDGLEGAKILDVGGGHAQLAIPLIERGFDVTVTGSDDCCQNRLKRFCKKGSYTYITCDTLNLPYEENEFDVVICFRLLPHAERWQEVVQEMCRVAKNKVIFDYPDRRSTNIFYDLLFGIKKKMEGNTRVFSLFSKKEIYTELQNNNFSHHRFSPQFFLPMVVHRKMNRVDISRKVEKLFRYSGLTAMFGSPIIVNSHKTDNQP